MWSADKSHVFPGGNVDSHSLPTILTWLVTASRFSGCTYLLGPPRGKFFWRIQRDLIKQNPIELKSDFIIFSASKVGKLYLNLLFVCFRGFVWRIFSLKYSSLKRTDYVQQAVGACLHWRCCYCPFTRAWATVRSLWTTVQQSTVPVFMFYPQPSEFIWTAASALTVDKQLLHCK